MKTKEFIEMLQKADPTGEGYIRLPGGGAPWFAEAKEGYWDGAYQYLELGEEKKYYPHDSVLVTSTKGYKIDIHVMETDTIIWDEDGDIERIKKRIRFDHYNEERVASYMKHIEDEAKYARGHHEKSVADWTKRVIEKYFDDNGYEIRQPLTTKIGQYNNHTAYPVSFSGLFKKKETLCQGECMALIESGKFYPEKMDEYYVWRYSVEKGKSWKI